MKDFHVIRNHDLLNKDQRAEKLERRERIELAKAVVDHYDADVFVYNGPLFPPYDLEFSKLVRRTHKNKNCILIITTPGGVAECAYRMGRTLQRCYKTYYGEIEDRGKLILFVPFYCKSAGTLLSLSADEILMSQLGELGPIDVQLLKHDEIGDRTSGLSAVGSFNLVESQALSSFSRFFRSMRFDGLRFPTKLAAETAAELTVGLFQPIVAQIDPMRFAEIQRSLQIASEYGYRLKTDNVREGSIETLTVGYQSHGFIIDRREARALFVNVDKPTNELERLGDEIVEFAKETGVLSDAGAQPSFWMESSELENPHVQPDNAEGVGAAVTETGTGTGAAEDTA